MVNYRGCSLFPSLLSLVLALAVFAALLVPVLYRAYAEESQHTADCVTSVEQFEVRGNSLAPLINPGQTIKLSYGYYNYYSVEREDIIAYKYAGNDVPIIKIVKAVPGDKWWLREDNGTYMIVVNGNPLLNSEGKSYQIPESNVRMLKLYVKSYPVLPDNTYLILGNKVSGSLDATRFGLIDKSDIVGKVVLSQ